MNCTHCGRKIETVSGEWAHVYDMPSGGHYLYCHVTVAEPAAA